MTKKIKELFYKFYFAVNSKSSYIVIYYVFVFVLILILFSWLFGPEWYEST